MGFKDRNSGASPQVVENGKSNKRTNNSSKLPAAGEKKASKKQRIGSTIFNQGTLAYEIVQVLEKHRAVSGKGGEGVNTPKDVGLTLQDIGCHGRRMKLEHCLTGGDDLNHKIHQIVSENPSVFYSHQGGLYSLVPGKLHSSTTKQHNTSQRTVITRKLRHIQGKIEVLDRQMQFHETELKRVKEEKLLVGEKLRTTSFKQSQKLDVGKLQEFEMPEAEKIFVGDEDDRKAMLEHRQVVQQRSKELEKAKENYIKEHEESINNERKEHLSLHRNLDKQLLNIEDLLKDAARRKTSLLAEKEVLSAELKALPDKKVVKRTQATSKEAQRYPMEDLKIYDQKNFIFKPEWLDQESASRQTKLLAISDNLLLVGSRILGTKAPSSKDLHAILVGQQDEKDMNTLYNLYQCLLEILVADGKKENGCRTTWSNAITDGCWPEILRRFVLRRTSDDTFLTSQLPDNHAYLAVSILASDPIENLTHDQHIALLYYLTDIVLVETSQFRDALQLREIQVIDLKRDIKELSKHGSKHEDKRAEAERKLLYKPMRRQPLGLDRTYRRYWWGLGGAKDEILIEEPISGRVAMISTEEGIDDLIASLDIRGIREKSLHATLMTIKDTIILNMRRANSAAHRDDEEQVTSRKKEPIRQSSRQTRQVEFFDPSKPRHLEKRERATRQQASSIQYRDELSILHLPPSVKTSFADAMATLIDMKRDAILAGISGPAGDESWEAWTRLVTHFGYEYGSKEYKELRSEDIVEVLKKQTCAIENVLNKKSKSLQGGTPQQNSSSFQGDEVDDEESTQEQSEVNETDSSFPNIPMIENCGIHDYESSVSRRNPKQSIFLWQTLRERTTWLSDVTCSQSPARIDLCIRILRLQSQPLIRKLTSHE